MLRRYFLLFFVWIMCGNLWAQQKGVADSLIILLSKVKDDTNKVILLSQVVSQCQNSEPNKIDSFSKMELALVNKLKWEKGIMYASTDKALYFNVSREYDSAIKYYNVGMEMARKYNALKQIAKINYELGYIQLELGRFSESLDCFFKSLTFFEKADYKIGEINALRGVGTVYIYIKEYNKANEYLLKALEIARKNEIKYLQGHVLLALGENYSYLRSYDSALLFQFQSLKIYTELKDSNFIYLNYAVIGKIYSDMRQYEKSLDYWSKIFDLDSKDLKNSGVVSPAYIGMIGQVYYGIATDTTGVEFQHSLIPKTKNQQLKKAVFFLDFAIELAKKQEALDQLQSYCSDISSAYRLLGNYKAALEYYEQAVTYRDTVYSLENKMKITDQETKRVMQLKEKQIEIEKLEVEKKRNERGYFSAAMVLLLIIVGVVFRNYKSQKRSNATLLQANTLVTIEKKRSDDLLLNILPAEVAEELKAKGSAEAKLIDDVTVLFTDFKGFTQLSEKLSPKELVGEINTCFSAFDNIMQKHGVEKIKTIGDAYMAAGGLPIPNKTHAADVLTAALEIQDFMRRHKEEREAAGKLFFEIRIGVHTGPVVAGIVGVKKFAYDIWGDTVNTASRMESSGNVGKVNISETTYELVKDKFSCEYRGEVEAKGKGVMKMYFVTVNG
jgi:adenylate cyclase